MAKTEKEIQYEATILSMNRKIVALEGDLKCANELIKIKRNQAEGTFKELDKQIHINNEYDDVLLYVDGYEKIKKKWLK